MLTTVGSFLDMSSCPTPFLVDKLANRGGLSDGNIDQGKVQEGPTDKPFSLFIYPTGIKTFDRKHNQNHKLHNFSQVTKLRSFE